MIYIHTVKCVLDCASVIPFTDKGEVGSFFWRSGPIIH